MENFNQIVSSEPVFSEKSVSERYFLISPTASLCSCFDLKGVVLLYYRSDTDFSEKTGSDETI